MVHDKQWILDYKKHVINGEWQAFEYGGRYVSYHKGVNIYVSKQSGIVLIGNAWQVDSTKPSPTEQMDALTDTDITIDALYALDETWCGRYVILYKDWVLMDATGSMGVFVSGSKASTSYPLLSGILGLHKNIYTYIYANEGTNRDFIPGQKTANEKIKRLLPSQVYNIQKQEFIFRTLLVRKYEQLSDEERIDRFVRYAKHCLMQIRQTYEYPIYCAVSGGYDSRVGLALLESCKLDYSTYTIDFGDRSIKDVAIAKKIVRLIKKPWKLLKYSDTQEDEKRIGEWNEHCAGLGVGWERYTRHVKEQLNNDGEIINLQCHIFELVCDYYSHEMDDPKVYYETFAQQGEFLESAYSEWLKLIDEDDVNYNVSIWTRMYWDLRLGSWLSSSEQGIDIQENMVQIQLLNSRVYIELLLGLDDAIRVNREWEKIVVQKLYPELAAIPYDNTYINHRIVLKKMLSASVKRMKTLLPTKVYASLKRRFGTLVHKV